MPRSPWMTMAETQERLELPRHRIHQLRRQGMLPAVGGKGGPWLFAAEAVCALQQKEVRRQLGVPAAAPVPRSLRQFRPKR